MSKKKLPTFKDVRGILAGGGPGTLGRHVLTTQCFKGLNLET